MATTLQGTEGGLELFSAPDQQFATVACVFAGLLLRDRERVASTRESCRPRHEHAAAESSELALNLRSRGVDSEQAAHFLMRLLFCLFADSIGLLPDHLFRQLIDLNRAAPAKLTCRLRQLFAAMSTCGNNFRVHDIHWFNGGLFADDPVLDLTSADLGTTLRAASQLDWSTVEPAIFGTFFERSLDPGKRSQLGAVAMAPLVRRWQERGWETCSTSQRSEAMNPHIIVASDGATSQRVER